MKILRNSLILFFSCLIVGFLLSGYVFKKEVVSVDPLSNLSLDQKIGQLFLIGVEGKVLNTETEELIREVKPGGILLLGRNIEDKEQLKEFILSLQKVSLTETGFPLLVAVDQEGGLISRISWAESTPQSEIENGYKIGLLRGKQLKEIGVNLNLAPLVEKAFPSDFIYERSLQEKAIEKASGLIRGQKEAGILTCVKHFPGYTGIDFNPEEDLAFVENMPSVLRFKEVFKEEPEMVMTSNVAYNDNVPFSFSEENLNLLDDSFVVITDDLSQNSLLKEFSLEEIIVSPFLAGSDILLFSGWRSPVKEGVEVFKKAVEEGKITEERIDSSVLKIIELKNEI